MEPQSGGHVLEPLPGLYTNVVVLDFKSLYPSLIRTFEIDPLNLVRPEAGQADADPIVAPNGAAFSRRKGILSEILDELMPRREEARRAGDAVKSHAIKILMNSFYGVLGTPACRFYDPRLANAITGFGRELLLWCQARIEAEGRRVLYGDTDSLFVESGEADADAARAFGETLAASLNRDLAPHIAERWRVTSRLELVFDRLYLRLCLPAMRHGTAGARKRYAGLVEAPDGARVRLHRHGGRPRRLDRAREGGPAGALRAALRRPARRRVPARGGRGPARRGASTTSSSTASPSGRPRRPTPPRRRPTWPRPARWRARGAAAWPT